jgi:hypothetical protein
MRTMRLLTPTTTASGGDGVDSPVINVVDTTGFASVGTLLFNGVEYVTYAGTTGTSFTGCSAHSATVGGEFLSSVTTPYDPFISLVGSPPAQTRKPTARLLKVIYSARVYAPIRVNFAISVFTTPVRQTQRRTRTWLRPPVLRHPARPEIRQIISQTVRMERLRRKQIYRLGKPLDPVLRVPPRPEIKMIVVLPARVARVERAPIYRLYKPLDAQIYPPIPVVVIHRLGKAGW